MVTATFRFSVVVLSVGALFQSAPTSGFNDTKSVQIQIENMQFSPAHVQVKKGEKITWTNHDLVPHTVTAEDKSFDSKSIAPGKSWTLKIKKLSAHSYKCSFHPTMLGSFEVE